MLMSTATVLPDNFDRCVILIASLHSSLKNRFKFLIPILLFVFTSNCSRKFYFNFLHALSKKLKEYDHCIVVVTIHMITRSQTKLNAIPLQSVQTQLVVDIDFDGASKAWRANKKSIGNGSFTYICSAPTKNGNPCQRERAKDRLCCSTHLAYTHPHII